LAVPTHKKSLLPLRKVKVAGPTRLELATSGVTGRRSNQLNYDPDNQSQNEDCKSPNAKRDTPFEVAFRFPVLHFSFCALHCFYAWWAVQDLNL
jgi:hypothetical protein